MQKTAMKIDGMSDEELGKWFRKAVIDLLSGCIDPNTDNFVREQYSRSFSRMVSQQKHNAQMYQNRKKGDFNKPLNEEELEIPLDDIRTPASQPEKHGYGPNHLVMLTEEEGTNLRQLYGTDLELAIEILDSYLLQGSKAAKAYKSHAAVLRRGNWVWKKVQETKTTEIRKQTAEQNQKNAQNRDGRTFRERDMDARGAEARMLMELQNG